ncbi:MAG: flavodoxin family protein [Prolixibacteraceae bacterium]
MKITIVDGSLSNYSKPDYTTELAIELNNQGHQVKVLIAHKKKINYCTGCWTCWWKTPGECIHKDDMAEFYKSYLQSDLVLHFSPLEMGFISSLLKTVNDRTIPLVHPYMALVNGECHHQKRYEKYPQMGLIVDQKDADEVDLQITKDLYERLALNLKTELKIFSSTQQTTEELSHAISRI